MVKFNVEEETGFLSSLEDLGSLAVNEVFDELQDIERRSLQWGQFVAQYGWARVRLSSVDTYPGADPLYWFAFVGPSGTTYQIAAKGPYGSVVVCSVVV